MLQSLSLRDLAVAGRVDLQVQSGMSVITGETGAGKSILVDALLLVAGGRADSGAVREGAERSEISAEFDLAALPAVQAWLSAEELDEDGPCVLRRVVRADGGSRAYINGRPASLQQMRTLASMLVEVHGQHEHQALLERAHQLDLLDQYAQHPALCAAVREAARHWRELHAAIESLRGNARDGADLIEFLRHQVRELEEADVTATRIAELESEHRLLAHAGELIDGLGQIVEALDGDEGDSVQRLLGHASHELTRLTQVDPGLADARALLESAQVQIDEALALLRRRRDSVDLDPERLAESEQDLARLHTLARKHRCTLQGLEQVQTELHARLESAEGAGTRLAALEAESEAALQAYRRHAERLRASRASAAQRLAAEVTTLMQELGMGGGRFEVAIESVEGQPQIQGSESLEFLVTANAGMPPRPLRKVASGGELARISLAIKVATIALIDTPVLVFDEVDSGIGGAVAEIVGRKLRALGARRQVLCVTHLAQVAACAHQHYRVSKHSSAGKTESRVDALGKAERIDELARMSGGVDITAATRAAAADLLQRLGKG
ncbi:MAG: DNA repair protein RecN [Lysobacterales bacterium]